MLNRVMLIGRVGGNPETVKFRDGGSIVKFSLATSERWTDKVTGEKRERTEWHSIVIHSEPIARFAEKYLSKGDLIYVEGKIETRQWEDQAGATRYKTEISVRPYAGELKLLSGSGNPARAQATKAEPVHEPLDDEIPF